MTVDLGTGDGHFVLARAAARPDELVLGVDASQGPMADASRRAARPVRRGGLPNARYVVAAVEALPPALDGIADLVTVHFPWGSLLRGALAADPAVAGRMASLLRPDGRLRLLLSAAEADARRGVTELEPERILAAHRRHGLEPRGLRPATLADIREARSSWGRRLLAGGAGRRRAWLVELERRR